MSKSFFKAAKIIPCTQCSVIRGFSVIPAGYIMGISAHEYFSLALSSASSMSKIRNSMVRCLYDAEKTTEDTIFIENHRYERLE